MRETSLTTGNVKHVPKSTLVKCHILHPYAASLSITHEFVVSPQANLDDSQFFQILPLEAIAKSLKISCKNNAYNFNLEAVETSAAPPCELFLEDGVNCLLVQGLKLLMVQDSNAAASSQKPDAMLTVTMLCEAIIEISSIDSELLLNNSNNNDNNNGNVIEYNEQSSSLQATSTRLALPSQLFAKKIKNEMEDDQQVKKVEEGDDVKNNDKSSSTTIFEVTCNEQLIEECKFTCNKQTLVSSNKIQFSLAGEVDGDIFIEVKQKNVNNLQQQQQHFLVEPCHNNNYKNNYSAYALSIPIGTYSSCFEFLC